MAKKPDIKQIKWRKHENGKYLGYFDTKEEAWECFLELGRRYRYRDYTVQELIEEYAEKGIRFHQTQTGKWLRKILGLKVKHQGRYSEHNKEIVTISLDSEVQEIRRQLREATGSTVLANKWFNSWLRLCVGLPVNQVYAFIEDEYGKKLVGFIHWKGEMRSIYVGKTTEGTRKLLESLCSDGEEFGYEYIKRKCERLGFYTLGNTMEEYRGYEESN